ncbi:hypothetical protein F4818DRAFT_148766 [Hypoxylon cercidicola]|nr:hypothetical protein F4818DRAFT_148766 [Hypoxylon cercidicola]
MGPAFPFQDDNYVLPDAAAPSLCLKHPTEEQKLRTWTLNHNEWGGALSLEDYLEREPYLTRIPLSRHGGMTHWILTDKAFTRTTEQQTEPVLATCETIRKRVLVATPLGVQEGIAHGIGSVFTYPEHRGNRYAGRMLQELGTALKNWQTAESVCSVLWSDIGKEYYAKKGWAAFPSSHVEFPVANEAQARWIAQGEQEWRKAMGREVALIRYPDLEELCERDEKLLRTQLLRTAQAAKRKCVAFAPDHDTIRWHLYRDDFIASLVFRDTPLPLGETGIPSSVKGACAGAEGRRVWALWSRNYGGSGGGDPAKSVDKNTMYILRLVIEPEAAEGGLGDEDEDVVTAFKALMHVALREARIWHLGKIDMWNPSPTAKRLIERSGLQHRWVERDAESIPSMMWYGDDEDVGDIEWVANEKYCWC